MSILKSRERSLTSSSMRFRILALLTLVITIGCGPAYVKTPAEIVRIDSGKMQACTVYLRMTLNELVESCGRPQEMVDWVNHAGGKCLIYPTEAQGFGLALRAPTIAVCVERVAGGEAGFLESSAARDGLEVVAVHGLAYDPNARP
jgi:hypothetical protein